MKPMNLEKKQLNQTWHQPKPHLEWKITKFNPMKLTYGLMKSS